MEFGTLYKYLECKLDEQGIKLAKISEAQTCSACGKRKKVSGRNPPTPGGSVKKDY